MPVAERLLTFLVAPRAPSTGLPFSRAARAALVALVRPPMSRGADPKVASRARPALPGTWPACSCLGSRPPGRPGMSDVVSRSRELSFPVDLARSPALVFARGTHAPFTAVSRSPLASTRRLSHRRLDGPSGSFQSPASPSVQARLTDICNPHLSFSKTSTRVSCSYQLASEATRTSCSPVSRPFHHGWPTRFGGSSGLISHRAAFSSARRPARSCL